MNTPEREGIEQFHEFGDYLWWLLDQRGMRGAELSRRIGVSARYVEMMLQGKRVPPEGSDYVDRIAKALADQPLSDGTQPGVDYATLGYELLKRQKYSAIRKQLSSLDIGISKIRQMLDVFWDIYDQMPALLPIGVLISLLQARTASKERNVLFEETFRGQTCEWYLEQTQSFSVPGYLDEFSLSTDALRVPVRYSAVIPRLGFLFPRRFLTLHPRNLFAESGYIATEQDFSFSAQLSSEGLIVDLSKDRPAHTSYAQTRSPIPFAPLRGLVIRYGSERNSTFTVVGINTYYRICVGWRLEPLARRNKILFGDTRSNFITPNTQNRVAIRRRQREVTFSLNGHVLDEEICDFEECAMGVLGCSLYGYADNLTNRVSSESRFIYDVLKQHFESIRFELDQ